MNEFEYIDEIKAPEAWKASAKELWTDAPAERRSALRLLRPLPLAAVIAVLLIGTALAVGSLAGGQGLLRLFDMTNEEFDVLADSEDSSITTPEASDTHDGITISVERCVIDAESLRAAIRIDGLEVPEGQEPFVYECSVSVDGERAWDVGWSVYNGLAWNGTNFVYDDGTPAELDGNGGVIPRYVRVDGSIEFDLDVRPAETVEMENLPGREITIQVGLVGCGEHWEWHPESAIEGPWVLNWIAEGNAARRSWELNEPLGDSGATVKTVTLSAASAHILYDYPEPETIEMEVVASSNTPPDPNAPEVNDADGQTPTETMLVDPPQLCGIVLRDGTEYTVATGGGTYGYNDENSTFEVDASLTRIIDPDEVAALVFHEVGIGDVPDSEAEFYTVTLPE